MDLFTRRVCLQLEGMSDVIVRRNVLYGPPERGVCMDLYYPPGHVGADRLPAVIIVAGYPGAMQPKRSTLAYKDFGWTVSMCELLAVSGMVAIAYTNIDPVADLRSVAEHIHDNATSLRIDPGRVGVAAVSGNVPTALTAIMRDAGRVPACAAFGYGCLLDLDGANDVADAALQFGFVNATAGRSVTDLRADVPLLITRAGRDQFPAMNASIDRFVVHALRENLPVTVVNHPEGPHAFDLFDDSAPSRRVIGQTLHFFRQNLLL